MAGMTGFQGGMLGLALAAVALGVIQQAPAAREPVQPAAETEQASQQLARPMTAIPVQVALVEASLLDLSRPAGGDGVETQVFVSNREPSPVTVRAEIVLSDSVTGRDTTFELSLPVRALGPMGVQPLRLRIPSSRMADNAVEKGYLKLIAGSGATAAMLLRPVRIAPAARAPWRMNLVLGIGFGLGFIVVGIAWRRNRPPKQAASLVWSRDSWATNLAIVASALVTFSGLAAPSVVFHYMTRAQYTSLGALIAGVILLANAFYAFVGVSQSSGGLARFALFAVVTATLGAALSQLVTLGFLVREAFEASVITQALYWVISWIVAFTGLALLWYAYQSVGKLAPQPPPLPGEHGKALPPRDKGLQPADASEKVAEAAGVKAWRLP